MISVGSVAFDRSSRDVASRACLFIHLKSVARGTETVARERDFIPSENASTELSVFPPAVRRIVAIGFELGFENVAAVVMLR